MNERVSESGDFGRTIAKNVADTAIRSCKELGIYDKLDTIAFVRVLRSESKVALANIMERVTDEMPAPWIVKLVIDECESSARTATAWATQHVSTIMPG